jgi:hypothetical protein
VQFLGGHERMYQELKVHGGKLNVRWKTRYDKN